MLAARRNKISEIVDEVNELHPLLHRLLPKLPTIAEVEYTHGNREMGADFVLAKHHEIFDSTEYIGVIAKIGRVLQDYADIERQIKECRVPRHFNNGKKEIRLTEVWVVATEVISNNAQQKIHTDFASTNIQFINGDKLSALVDKYLPNYWLEMAIEVSEYLTKLKAKNAETDKKLSLIKTEGPDIYIEQDLTKMEKRRYGDRQTKPQKKVKVKIREEIDKYRMIWVEGGMGAGKSKLLRQLVNYYCQPDVYTKTQTFPIPLTFKEMVEEFDCDIEAAVDNRLGKEIGQEIRDESNYLLLIDAVDERDSPLDDQLAHIQKIVDAVNNSTKIRCIITSRALRGFDNSHPLFKGIAAYEMADLSVNQLIKFLSSLCPQFDLTSRIVEDLKKSSIFKQLPHSPIGAILLAELLNQNTQDLPSNLTELYAKYVELMLGRWDMDKGLQSLKEYEALDHILMNVARYIIENELNEVSIDEIMEMFGSYLNGRNLKIEPRDLFTKMRNRCEIIAIDDDDNTFCFKHRTFAEFFYAKSLMSTGDFKVNLRVFHPYWMNTCFFFLGIKKDAPEFLREIIALDTPEEGQSLMKIINMHNYFLAAYLSPYDVIVEGMMDVAMEAAKRYQSVVENPTHSALQNMPRMHVLYLFQYLIRLSYSYEFLKNAIEMAAAGIEGTSEDDISKCYALFFLNVAMIDIDAAGSFDYLLEKYAKIMPLDLSRAISHEGSFIKNRSDLMRKHDQKLKRSMKGNRGLQSFVLDLYEKPLKAINASKSVDSQS